MVDGAGIPHPSPYFAAFDVAAQVWRTAGQFSGLSGVPTCMTVDAGSNVLWIADYTAGVGTLLRTLLRGHMQFQTPFGQSVRVADTGRVLSLHALGSEIVVGGVFSAIGTTPARSVALYGYSVRRVMWESHGVMQMRCCYADLLGHEHRAVLWQDPAGCRVCPGPQRQRHLCGRLAAQRWAEQ